MTTTGSFSDGAKLFSLYKTELRRQSHFMIIFFIIFFLVIMLPTLLIITDDYYIMNPSYMSQGIYFDEAQAIAVHVLGAVMALVLALFANSYMHNRKTVDLYHSLPVRREHLLSANFLASMTSVLAPFLAVCILTMLVQIPVQATRGLILPSCYFPYILWDVLYFLVYAAIVYLFVTFVAVNVGTVFDSFAIAAILGWALLFLVLVSGYVWSEMTYGAAFEPGEWVMLLSPFVIPFYRYRFAENVYAGNGYYTVFSPLPTALFFLAALVLAAALFAGSVALYKRRKSETAERAQSGGVFQTIVKCICAYAGSAFLLLFFQDTGLPARIVAMLAGAILIGAVAEIILSRGIRSLLKNLRWLAGTGAVCALAVVGLRLDITGYESRVPAVDQVAGVSVSSYGSRQDSLSGQYWRGGAAPILTSPESISLVTEMHRAAVENRPDEQDRYSYSWGRGVYLEYRLQNGRILTRRYNQIDADAFSILAGLEAQDDFIEATCELFTFERAGGRVESVTVTDSLRNSSGRAVLDGAEMQALLDSVRSDMKQETLSEIMNPTAPAHGYLTFTISYSDTDRRYGAPAGVCCVLVTPEYTRTIETLRELGLYDKMTDVQEPEAAWIRYWYPYEYNRVVGLSPVETDDYAYEELAIYIEERESGAENTTGYVAGTQKASEVASVFQRSDNQRFVGNAEGDDLSQTVYQVVFTRDGRGIGTKLIGFDELPAAVQEEIRSARTIYGEDYQVTAAVETAIYEIAGSPAAG